MIKLLQKSWKEITILSTWITTITTSLLVPLPSWSISNNYSQYFVRFIVFFATVITGFLVLKTYKNKKIKHWYLLSIVFLILSAVFFVGYNHILETKTLPYEKTDIVIGDARIKNDPLTKLEIKNGGPLKKTEILKHFSGDSSFVWSLKSIQKNKYLLLFLFSAFVCSVALLMISISNLFILHRIKYTFKE